MGRRVLCFLYYFPPSGGPGVLRGLKFVKHLRDFGFTPVVVTVDAGTYENPWEYAPDPSTLDEVPPDIEVHRVPCGEPVRLERLLVRAKLMRAAQFLLYPLFWERQALWPLPAIRRGREILKGGAIDLLYTCCGPYASNLIGMRLSRQAGIPWVTDHRDPWTQGWSLHWPSRLHHRLLEHVEAAVVRRCSHLIANTVGQREELLGRFPGARRERVTVIPNGYDESDFSGAAPEREPDRFVLLHAGSFDDRGEEVGGGPGRVRRWLRDRLEYRNRIYDHRTHSPEPILGALESIRAGRPDVYGKTEFRMVGSVSETWRRVVTERGLGDAVRFLGPRPHAEAVARMRAADLLVLTTISRRDGGRVSRVSQKAYEYLRAGPRILALCGPGDTRDLVLEAGAGSVVEPGDREGLAGEIISSFEAGRRGARPELGRDEDLIGRYDRRALTGRLASVFEKVLEGAASKARA